MLIRILGYIKPYTMRLVALLVTAVLVAGFTLVEPATLGILTDALFSRTKGISVDAYFHTAAKKEASSEAILTWDEKTQNVSEQVVKSTVADTGVKALRMDFRSGYSKIGYQLPGQVSDEVILKTIKENLNARGIKVEVARVIQAPVNRGNLLFSQFPTVFIIPFLLVFFQIFRGLFSYCQMYLAASIGQKVIMQMRNQIFEHLQNLSFGFYEQKQTGQLMSKVLSDVGMVQNLFSSTIIDLIVEPIMVILAIGWALYINWKLTLIFLIIMPLIALLIGRIGRMMRKVGKKIQQNVADTTAILQETISAIRVVKSFAMEDYEIGRFRSQTKKNYLVSMKGVRLQGILNPAVELLALIGLGILIWYGGNAVYRMEMTPGQFWTFVLVIGYISNPIKKLSRVSNQIQHSLAAADNIFKLLDEKSDVPDPEHPISLPSLRGEIVFSNVSFCYKAGEPVLKGINFQAKPGEVIALVGSSGAGKTTLVNLVPRFYDPVAGDIWVDGVNLREVDLKSYRRQMGIVPQETVLFTGTIRENIAYGRIDATPQEIEAAAKAANAHDFIGELSDGYQTMVGERGVTLSGGQRQRVAIARAILRDPKILILDEATSALDIASEILVQDALQRLMKNRTTFVIAHRLSTIRNADRILVMNDGLIVEVGSHEELLQKGGAYQALYQKQFAAKEDLTAETATVVLSS